MSVGTLTVRFLVLSKLDSFRRIERRVVLKEEEDLVEARDVGKASTLGRSGEEILADMELLLALLLPEKYSTYFASPILDSTPLTLVRILSPLFDPEEFDVIDTLLLKGKGKEGKGGGDSNFLFEDLNPKKLLLDLLLSVDFSEIVEGEIEGGLFVPILDVEAEEVEEIGV